jgi:hypothetical protein
MAEICWVVAGVVEDDVDGPRQKNKAERLYLIGTEHAILGSSRLYSNLQTNTSLYLH